VLAGHTLSLGVAPPACPVSWLICTELSTL
jgi:hypothetical protein